MKDAKNRSLNIVKLPTPLTMKDTHNSPLPASYANFLITNEAVLVPIFQQKTDEKALCILKEVFSKDVIGIDSSSMVFGKGTIQNF